MRMIIAAVIASLTAAAAACSPGSLPGSPSPIQFGGGGGRYDGSITYRRLGGSFTIDEALQQLALSLTLTTDDQFSGEFRTPSSSGTLQGTIDGQLNDGSFRATVLLSLTADSGASAPSISPSRNVFRPRAIQSCEGRGEATGTFSGPNISWTIENITYTNCSLVTSSQANAQAVSPIPAPQPARANVVIRVFPGATIRRGTCEDGRVGYPIVIEIAETAGVSVTFDATIVVEERRGANVVNVTREDNPIRSLGGGERRRWSACAADPGTYQAFLTGRDANGNTFRVASPIITFE